MAIQEGEKSTGKRMFSIMVMCAPSEFLVAARWSIDARDEAFGASAVVEEFLAEGVGEGGFLDMDAIEQRADGGDKYDGEGDPVAGLQADGGKDEHQSRVGRVADEAEEA